ARTGKCGPIGRSRDDFAFYRFERMQRPIGIAKHSPADGDKVCISIYQHRLRNLRIVKIAYGHDGNLKSLSGRLPRMRIEYFHQTAEFELLELADGGRPLQLPTAFRQRAGYRRVETDAGEIPGQVQHVQV